MEQIVLNSDNLNRRNQQKIARAINNMTANEAYYAARIIFRYLVAWEVAFVTERKLPKRPFLHAGGRIICAYRAEMITTILKKIDMNGPTFDEYVSQVVRQLVPKALSKPVIEATVTNITATAENSYIKSKEVVYDREGYLALYGDAPVLVKKFGDRTVVAIFFDGTSGRPSDVIQYTATNATRQKTQGGAKAMKFEKMAAAGWKSAKLEDHAAVVDLLCNEEGLTQDLAEAA